MAHTHAKSEPAAPEPKFYQASNRVGSELFVWLPITGGLGAFILGTIYAFVAALLYEIEQRWWLIIATPLFAALVGPFGQWVCQLGNVRRRAMRMPIVYLVTAMTLYGIWHAYLTFERHELSTVHATWHMSPITLFRGIGELARERGALSVVGWVLEAATVFGFVAWGMRGLDPEVPFCEGCGKWTAESFRLKFADSPHEAVVERFKQGHAEDLPKLGRWESGMLFFIQVRVMECPCLASRYATVERVKIKPGTSGRGLYMRRRRTARASWTVDYDIGTFDETEQTPVLENIQIDGPFVDKLKALREQEKAKGE